MIQAPKQHSRKPNLSCAAFLVRCWRDGEQWRIVLEDVATRERRGFDNLEAFLEALQAMLDQLL